MNDKHKTKTELITELQELRRRVAQMKESEESQHNHATFPAAETAASAIFIFQDAVFRYTNPATSNLTGYTAEELLGADIWKLVHPEYRELIRERFLAWQRGEPVPSRSEFKILTKSGETRWIDADSTVIEFGGNPAALAIAYDSTDHRLTVEALKKSDERFRRLIETAQEAIWAVDTEANTTYANQCLAEMLGYTRDELLGRSVFDFVDDADRREAAEYLERGRSGIKEQHDFRFRRRDGSELWTMVSTMPLFDGAGVLVGGLATLIDITERRRSEEALKESEARLQAAIENLPFELWVRDRDGRCIMQSSYSVLQWGHQIGKRLEDMNLDPETLTRWEASNRRAFAGEVIKGEYEITAGDQAGYYYNVIAPIQVEGKVHSILGVNIDITERKRDEEALRESEAKFRVMAETAASAIFIYRGEKLVYANPAAELHTGYDREELLKITIWDLVHPEYRELVEERGRARQRGEWVPQKYEFKIVTKGGETRWVEASASSLEYEGKPAVLGTAFDITAHKRAEEELRKTQERLQHVLSLSPATIYLLKPEDKSFTLEWMSEGLTRLTGYELDEALSEGWWVGRVHPDDRGRVLAEMPRLFTGDHLVHEYRFQHKDGGYLWLHDETRLWRDESGKPVEAIGSWVDVSERREAEAALRDSEERFRTLVSSMNDIVVTVDRHQRHTGVFGRWRERFGLERADFIGKTPIEILGAEAARVHIEANARALGGEQVVYEWSLTNEQGAFHFQTSLSPIRDESGEVTGLVGVGRDITQRKWAEQVLRESQSLLEAILDHCPAMIFLKDLDGRYLQINRRFEQTFNLTPEQVLGRTDAEVFPADMAAAFQETDRKVLGAGRSTEFEEQAVYADGRHTFIVHKFPIQDAAGNVYAVGGISTDITSRKRAEDDLRKQKEILQKIFDHVPVMLTFIGEDNRIKLVNQEWERTLGWSLEEVRKQRLDILSECYPDPQYRQEVVKFVAESNGEWADFKPRVRDGRVIDTTWARVYLSDGTSIGIGQDITERKHAEEALRDSQERFRRYFELGLVGMTITSPAGGYLEVNDRLCEILGYERSELLHMSWAELTHQDDLASNVANFNRVQAGESDGYSMEKRFIRKDGKVIHATISVKCLRRADGSIDYFVALLQDITERKRADELLRRQTAQLAALHEIELEIGAESELSRVLEVITRRAAELLNAYHCSIYIRDQERFELNLVASLDNELIGLRLKEGEGLAGRVALSGDAQAIDDYSEWKGRASTLDAKDFGPVLGAPLKRQQTVIGAICLARRRGKERFTHDDINFVEQIAADAAIAIHQATLFEEVLDGRRRLQVLSHRLIDVQEAERKRLARELHDQIGQALTAVQISLQTLSSSTNGGSAKLLEDSLAIIDDALQHVHDLSLDLRPSLLDDLGLVSALRWYVDRVTSRAGLVDRSEVDELHTRLAPEVETACFRIAQEALTNVVRHAHAASVSVEVKYCDSGLRLLVRDDGVGFDVRAALSRTGLNASLGLQGMQERAAAIGGLVDIESKQGCGTEVQATFPLKQDNSC